MEGANPIQAFYLGIPSNFTIAASMAGTSPATLIGTISAAYACGIEVFNLTGRNLELVFGNDNGTAAYVPGNSTIATLGSNSQIFCPGTASVLAAGRVNRVGMGSMTAGLKIFARTTENTPITASSTSPFIINLWA